MIRYSAFFSGNSTLRALLRTSSMIAAVLVAMTSIGCRGPMGGIGPGCSDGHCYDCDGTAGRPIPTGPLDGIRNFKRSLVCGGGGCGETYVGEWISTPPDCSDPCCGDQFVGGATKCRPFCWQPGSLLGSFSLYGQRHCDGSASSTPCGCGGGGGSCEGECYGDEYYGGETISGCDGGCASCAASSSISSGGQTRYARNTPLMSARTKMQATSDPAVQRLRR